MNIAFLAIALLVQPGPVDPNYEGDWYISDTTDNGTGEREVYAFQTRIEAGDPDYVTLKMRCSNGKPAFFVEWNNLEFPDQTILTIGSVSDADAEPEERQYPFEKSQNPVDQGLRASPEISAAVIAAISAVKYATVTAHLPSGNRQVGLEVSGTQRAWNRVSRHCPVRIMPPPPQ